MTITEFLTARYDEDETVARAAETKTWASNVAEQIHILRWDPARVLADIAAKRAILALHESWPVLVEGKPEFEASADVADMTMRVSQQMAWLTNQEYRKRFGDEPPTSQIVIALAQPYAEHPDFDEAWRV